jgi:hypothetical protein
VWQDYAAGAGCPRVAGSQDEQGDGDGDHPIAEGNDSHWIALYAERR